MLRSLHREGASAWNSKQRGGALGPPALESWCPHGGVGVREGMHEGVVGHVWAGSSAVGASSPRPPTAAIGACGRCCCVQSLFVPTSLRVGQAAVRLGHLHPHRQQSCHWRMRAALRSLSFQPHSLTSTLLCGDWEWVLKLSNHPLPHAAHLLEHPYPMSPPSLDRLR